MGIFRLVTGLLSGRLGKWLKWLFVIALIGTVVYMIMDYGKSRERVSNLMQENTRLVNKRNSLKNALDQQTKRLNELQVKNRQRDSSYNRQVESIRKYKKDGADQDPSQIKQEVNARFNDFQKRLMCSTGDQSKCGN